MPAAPHRDPPSAGPARSDDAAARCDTTRLPYGCEPATTVRGFTCEVAEELVERGAKAIVVACDSAAPAGLADLAAAATVPVWGVVESGVSGELAAHRGGPVGVLGTHRTITSGTYQARLADAGVEAWARACPLFVPVVEEGLAGGEIAELVARPHLADRPPGLRPVILGCTHYPALVPTPRDVLDPTVMLVDGAGATAEVVAAGDVLPPRLPLTPRAAWTARAEVAA